MLCSKKMKNLIFRRFLLFSLSNPCYASLLFLIYMYNNLFVHHCYQVFLPSFSFLQVKIWFQNRRARERRDKEAADKGEVVTSSNLRSPTTAMSIASSPSLIPSPHHHTNSMIASTSATLLSLSANGMPRLSASSPVGMSAFTPVSLSYDLKSATAAAVLSSMHHQQQSHQNQNNL